ncbi:MAG: 50S ribosomal protein L6 [Geminicoccales bacterium]
MSRVGKNPISVPSGVEVRIERGTVTTKGGLGQLGLKLTGDVKVSLEDGKIWVRPANDSKQAQAMWGTVRAILRNMVVGVSNGFTKTLEISGVGYRAAVQGNSLQLQLGYSNDISYRIPQGIKVACERPTSISITGADKQRVGQVAAEIRGFRRPEPYKGKGIRYADEVILRKEGKKK